MTFMTIKRWLPFAAIIVLIGMAWAFGLTEKINLETIKEHKAYFQEQASEHPVVSVLAFIAAYTASVALSLPIASVLTLLGGFLFGPWVGTAVIVVSATAGASILFLVARSALGATLREKAGPLYAKVAANMERNAAGYMLFMRLVPVFPFFLVNIVPALFNVGLGVYMATTFLGIIPGTFVYANLGQQLGTIGSLKDLVSVQTLLAFTLLGLIALIPIAYKKFRTRTGKAAAA